MKELFVQDRAGRVPPSYEVWYTPLERLHELN